MSVSPYRERDDPDRRVCSKCRKKKRADAFTPGHWYCRICTRLTNKDWRQTEAYRAWYAEWSHRPEVRERRRANARARRAVQAERRRRDMATPVGRIRKQMWQWRCLARSRPDAGGRGRAALRALACQRELTRLLGDDD